MLFAKLAACHVFSDNPEVFSYIYSPRNQCVAACYSMAMPNGSSKELYTVDPGSILKSDWVYCVRVLPIDSHGSVIHNFTLEIAVTHPDHLGDLSAFNYLSPQDNPDRCLLFSRLEVAIMPDELSVMVASIGIASTLRKQHLMLHCLLRQLGALSELVPEGVKQTVYLRAENIATALFMSCSDAQRKDRKGLDHAATGQLDESCDLEADLKKVLSYNKSLLLSRQTLLIEAEAVPLNEKVGGIKECLTVTVFRPAAVDRLPMTGLARPSTDCMVCR